MTNLNHNRPILRLIDDNKKALREFNKRSAEAAENARPVRCLKKPEAAKPNIKTVAAPKPDILTPQNLKDLSNLVDAIAEYHLAAQAYAIRFDKEKRRCKPTRAKMNFMNAEIILKARIRTYVGMALRNIADNDRRFSPVFYQTHMKLIKHIEPMRAVHKLFIQETKVLEPYVRQGFKTTPPTHTPK